MKKYLNDKFLWISAGITIALTFVMFALNGIVFTNKIYAQADMYYQFIPFYEGIWDKAHEGGALFTWNMGGGISIWYIISYCFMSPFNILALICPRSFIPIMMNIIIALKMGAMAYSFNLAVKYFYKKTGLLSICLSVGYAVSGYVLANMWNLMWFDALYLFPIVIIGLYRLVKYKKFLLFTIALGTTIISNYFISVTVIITSVIVYILLCISFRKKDSIIRFIISLALAAGIGAIVIIPQLFMYKYTLASGETIGSFKAMIPFGEVIARHMINSPSYVDEYWFPNIYMGVFFIPILPLIFLRKIELRKKICIGVLLSLFIFSFIFTYPQFLWHGLHYTNSVVSRHSFMYIFFCLFFSYDVLSNIKEFKKKHLFISIIVSVIYLIFMYRYGSNEATTATNYNMFRYSYRDLIINTVFIGMYIVFFLEKISKISFLILAEFVTNFFFIGFKPPSQLAVNELYDFSIKEIEKEIPNEKLNERSEYIGNNWNRGMEWNFPSVSGFSSASPKSFKQLDQLGTNGCYNSTTNQYSLNGATEILLDMFSVKHIITDKGVEDRDTWGFGFVAKDNNIYIDYKDWMLNHNYLIEAITGVSDAIILIEDEVPEDGWLYADYGSEIELNGKEYKLSRYSITQIKEAKKGEKIDVPLYFLSKKKREEAFVESLDIEIFEDGYVKGKAPVDGEYVFTTPIQPGWTALINGEKRDLSTYADLFISIPLKKNDVLELKYTTPGLGIGIGISIATIAGICLYTRGIKNGMDSYTRLQRRRKLKKILPSN